MTILLNCPDLNQSAREQSARPTRDVLLGVQTRVLPYPAACEISISIANCSSLVMMEGSIQAAAASSSHKNSSSAHFPMYWAAGVPAFAISLDHGARHARLHRDVDCRDRDLFPRGP